MSTGSTPSTIGEVLAAKKSSGADVQVKQDAATAADAAFKAAQEVDAAADAAVKSDLPLVGGSAYTDDNGVITVYVTDQSATGYHSFQPVPESASLAAPPFPVPSPTPAPPVSTTPTHSSAPSISTTPTTVDVPPSHPSTDFSTPIAPSIFDPPSSLS